MDHLSLYAALNAIRIGPRETPPFWDKDLAELYRVKLAEAGPQPSTRHHLAVALAGWLERLAARLRGEARRPAYLSRA